MKGKLPNLKIAVSIALSVFVTLFVLSVQRAYAASCFTDTSGYWAETFICWMKNTGLSSGYSDGTFRPDNSITRAEVAALLYKLESGDTYVNMGTSAWQVNNLSNGSGYIIYGTGEDTLHSVTTGSNYYQISVPLITSLHGQQLTAKGAKLCYDASATGGGSIASVEVELTSINGFFDLENIVSDNTTRNDRTCRTYLFSTPTPLDGSMSLNVIVKTNLVSTSDYVTVSGVTAIQGFNATSGVLAPVPDLGLSGPVPGTKP